MKIPALPDLILFENDDYLILNKPPFLATLDERTGGAPNMLRLVRQTYPDAQMAHRIDKETSGALAVAKHPAAYRHLSMQFEAHTVQKLYHAVANGVHQFHDEVVERSVEISPRGGKARLAYNGKEATTILNTMETFRRHTLVAAQPITGRMHQIRLHLLFKNAPIVGDDLYGAPPLYLSTLKRNFNLRQGTEELPVIQRFALHAAFIGFEGLDGQEIRVEAPYPKDFAVLVKLLRQYS